VRITKKAPESRDSGAGIKNARRRSLRRGSGLAGQAPRPGSGHHSTRRESVEERVACHEQAGKALGQELSRRVEWWRRRELNPGPRTFSATALHV